MKKLRPLNQIAIPAPKPDEIYEIRVLERQLRFKGLKQLLGAADISKAGDRLAGLAPEDDMIREAARSILSSLTLQHLYNHPLTDESGRVDTVSRAGYDIDHPIFKTISNMTLGELKNHLLESNGKKMKRIGKALTPMMAAALAKLMDVHELIFLPGKIFKPTKARTRIGLPGVLSFRLQPNHPQDSLDAISLLVYTGLSHGMGDCLIGVNPSDGSIPNIIAILRHLDKLRRETGAPTQICVLGHVKSQMAALDYGAPVEILFQSIAGTERTLTEGFDVTVDYMDDAYETMAEKGALKDIAEQYMYFETGQGSEITYRKHNGIDMTTCEALCYGLCRRYDPFMVNSATGFIGPETHLNDFELMVSNLQDHFMGKLLGLPMGISPSYTLHANSHLEGAQMATHLATAAGANFFMAVYLGTDRMLAHFVNSGHDGQTLREIYHRTPAPEFLAWAIEKNIYKCTDANQILRGNEWGNPRLFCSSETEFRRLHAALPVAPGFENAGPRPVDAIQRELMLNQSVGRKAVHSELQMEFLKGVSSRIFKTTANNKEDHLKNPGKGSALSSETLEEVSIENRDVQIVVTDGLSAEAVHLNAPEMLRVLEEGLKSRGFSMGRHILARYGRVKLAETIGDALGANLIIVLIGERPGGDALASRSMSAYLTLNLKDQEARHQAAEYSGHPDIRYEYTLISNIYPGGLPAIEAGSVVVEKTIQILTHQAAGNRLEDILQAKTPGQERSR